MASSKDTFEPNTFESNSFACGTWRGIGVSVTVTASIKVATFRTKSNVADFPPKTTVSEFRPKSYVVDFT